MGRSLAAFWPGASSGAGKVGGCWWRSDRLREWVPGQSFIYGVSVNRSKFEFYKHYRLTPPALLSDGGRNGTYKPVD